MTIEINLKALAATAVAAVLTIMTANGTIDNYITFAGEANAAAFCLVAGVMTIFGVAATFNVKR